MSVDSTSFLCEAINNVLDIIKDIMKRVEIANDLCCQLQMSAEKGFTENTCHAGQFTLLL